MAFTLMQGQTAALERPDDRFTSQTRRNLAHLNTKVLRRRRLGLLTPLGYRSCRSYWKWMSKLEFIEIAAEKIPLDEQEIKQSTLSVAICFVSSPCAKAFD